MPAERFYVDADFVKGGEVVLAGPELHHLAHVMRVREGEEVELVNGRGGFAVGRVREIGKKEGVVEVERCSQGELLPRRLTLAVPLMRPAKLEWVIEKGTELGADAFWLYKAEFSEKGELTEHQMERLVYIAVSAMKQCGRLDLPEIKKVAFDEMTRFEGIILYGDTREKAEPIRPENRPVIFVTGPEKGFSQKELQKLERCAKGVRLHKNILRAETAPIAASCLLHF